uniref:Uncharacterized protein n=1 Tax=Oryza brachyantha TaxID=4533 RepID=J3LEJ5_ORYBR
MQRFIDRFPRCCRLAATREREKKRNHRVSWIRSAHKAGKGSINHCAQAARHHPKPTNLKDKTEHGLGARNRNKNKIGQQNHLQRSGTTSTCMYTRICVCFSLVCAVRMVEVGGREAWIWGFICHIWRRM